MRKAVVDVNGTVINVIEAGERFSIPGFTLVAVEGGNIGDFWDGKEFISQEPVAVLPERQLLQEKLAARTIAYEELVELLALERGRREQE